MSLELIIFFSSEINARSKVNKARKKDYYKTRFNIKVEVKNKVVTAITTTCPAIASHLRFISVLGFISFHLNIFALNKSIIPEAANKTISI